MLVSEPNGAAWDGLFGAVIGAVIAGGMSVCLLALQLRADKRRRETKRAGELKSLATALYCETMWFWFSALIFNTQAGLSKLNEKMPISFIRPPLNFVTFTIFESNASKIGLFETSTVEKLLEFVYDAKLYLALAQEHKRRLNERDHENIPYNDEKAIEETLHRSAEELDNKIEPLSDALKAVAQIE
jgi:hypothetical protein